MFTWVELPDGLDGDDVLAAGLRRGIAVVPGSAFDAERTRSAIRLCFSAVDDVAIDTGIACLGDTIRDILPGAAQVR
jgi:2-aminoadipate transaminase